jgi:aminoglycoside phosphotransferase (APT) family kinase protein
MTNPYDDIHRRVYVWLQKVMGQQTKVRSIAPLPGATSSAVFEIELDGEGSFVLRLFTNRDWLKEEPDLARHEAESLRISQQVPVATPQLITVDETGEACGYPAVLMSKCEGKIDLFPPDRQVWLCHLAKALRQLHIFKSRQGSRCRPLSAPDDE